MQVMVLARTMAHPFQLNREFSNSPGTNILSYRAWRIGDGPRLCRPDGTPGRPGGGCNILPTVPGLADIGADWIFGT
jgi:hypothetical protein